jgi:hypothetical protein
MSNPILALANVKRRLAHRTTFVAGPDPDAVAASLRAVLAELGMVHAGRASLLPVEPVPETPAMAAVHRQLDRIAAQFAASEREAAQAKRQRKLERRAKRRAEATRTVEPPPAQGNGLPQELPPTPAAAAPVAEDPPRTPVPLATLRY